MEKWKTLLRVEKRDKMQSTDVLSVLSQVDIENSNYKKAKILLFVFSQKK